MEFKLEEEKLYYERINYVIYANARTLKNKSLSDSRD